jgi:uncharacterized membrane protein (DUF373 family)
MPPAADAPPTGATAHVQRFGQWIEVAISICGGFFLIAAAIIVLADTVPSLWHGPTALVRALSVLDHVLLVFVLVEVFHTVRLAISRHEIQAEPFLIVVIIAAVRRILVVTAGNGPIEGHDTLIELGLLVALLLAAAGALVLLRQVRAG